MNRRNLIQASLNAVGAVAAAFAAVPFVNLPVPPHRYAGSTTLVIGEPTTAT